MDAVEILKLKPGLRLEDDVTAWAFERSGLYSVRSCYRMLKRENDQLEAFKINESESSLNSPWWTKLWKLKIPPKVTVNLVGRRVNRCFILLSAALWLYILEGG
jgi:hypothetical protein